MSIRREVNRFIDYIENILPGCASFEFTDKRNNIGQHMAYMLNRTQSMFKWSGLPDSIPARMLELYLQANGNCCFYEHEGTLYVFTGGRGGVPDVYYMPTIYTIANPALKLSVQAKIDEDCVVMPNDSMYMGLLPMFARYATAMAETELSIDIATVNSRIIDLISAPDDRTKESAEKFLEDVRDGRQGVIAENAFLEGIKAMPFASSNGNTSITNLIELIQYQKASWFNELGINANYNMKRESINAGESQLNDDALLPLVDDMLRCRQIFAEKVNAMFGTEISVSLASAWEDNKEELEAEQAILEADAEPETVETVLEETPPETVETASEDAILETSDETPEDSTPETPEEVVEAAKEIIEAAEEIIEATDEPEKEDEEDEGEN